MKRTDILRRIGAAALALVLLLGPSGLGLATSAQAAPGIDEAALGRLSPELAGDYLSIIDKKIRQYGTPRMSGDAVRSTGFAGGYLMDLNSDGVPELCTITFVEYHGEEAYDYDPLYDYNPYGFVPLFEIWSHRGYTYRFYDRTVDYPAFSLKDRGTSLALAKRGGDYYLAVLWNEWDNSHMDTFVDSSGQTVNQIRPGGIIPNYFYYRVDQYSVLNSASDAGNEPFESFADTLYPLVESTSSENENQDGFHLTAPLNVNELRAAIAGRANIPVGQIASSAALAALPYVGERGRCKMDAEMANAYAEVIEGLPVIEPSWETSSLHAALADFSGDGLPILITVYGRGDSWYSVTFWGYQDGAAYQVDGLAIGEVSVVDILYGRADGVGVMILRSDESYFQEPSIFRCYTVSRGQIEPIQRWKSDNINGYGSHLAGLGISFKEEGTLCRYNSFDSNDKQIINTVPAAVAAVYLRAYAAAGTSPFPHYDRVSEDEDAYVKAVAEAAAKALGGEVGSIYKLADGVYYVEIIVDGAAKGTIVRGARRDGQIVWDVVERYDEAPEEETLDDFVIQREARPNLSLDYGKLSGVQDAKDVADYVRGQLSNMDGVAPNDAAKAELSAFLESAATALGTGTVEGKDNRVTVDAEAAGDAAKRAKGAASAFEKLLRDEDVTLNKPLTIILRIIWRSMDWGEPCELTFDRSLAEALDGYGVKLLLGGDKHFIQLSGERLKSLVDRYGAVVVQFMRSGDNTYVINFLDASGNALEQMNESVTVGLPSGSMTGTIMASYGGRSDNWGGQYDGAAGTIAFETRYSGQYEVIENNVNITDIAELPEDVQRAIRFMASKGYLDVEDGKFRPDELLTRYQFTQALTGMFFALDRSMTTSFPDVPPDSPYYAYVASAEAKKIVNGLDDGTFGGENNMTTEQMLAVAARTLIEQKGYDEPQNPAGYLGSFTDGETVSEWARAQVAMSVRDEIKDRGGVLNPQGDITRSQAADILYRLFLLLYEVPPVALELPPETETVEVSETGGADTERKTPSAAVIAAAGGGTAAVIGGVWYYLVKKRPKV